MALACIALLTLHFSPGTRCWLQGRMTSLDSAISSALREVIGSCYSIHSAESLRALTVSLADRLPTRYVRDLAFWLRMRSGDAFVAQAAGPNPYGVTHMFFERDDRQRDLVFSMQERRSICIGELKAWVLKQREKPQPVYVLDGSEYVLTLVTDDSQRWGALERACTS